MAAPYRIFRDDNWIYGDYDPNTKVFTPEDGGEPFDTLFITIGVLQFTGLTDSKGVPIYEGDYVYDSDYRYVVTRNRKGKFWLERGKNYDSVPGYRLEVMGVLGVWVRESDGKIMNDKVRVPLTPDLDLTVDGSICTIIY